MDMHTGTPANVPDPMSVAATPATDSEEPAAAETAQLSARFVLVEDLEYLYRTGTSRRILAAQWFR